jgi:hypothetical protein
LEICLYLCPVVKAKGRLTLIGDKCETQLRAGTTPYA